MDFITEKIKNMCWQLNEWKTVSKKEIDFLYLECPEYKVTNTPTSSDADWKSFKNGNRFSGIDNHYWMHFKIPKISKEEGKEARLTLKTGREGQWDACNPQFTVYLNGKTTQALDVNHTWLPLEYEKEYDVYIYAYTGMDGGNFDVLVSIDTVDLAIEGLFYDINVPYLSMLELPKNKKEHSRGISTEDSYNYIKIRNCLDKALMKLDLREVYSEDFYKSINEATKYLKEEFYEKICGNSESVISCIGHTHIDVAWLWTVAQTREKAQRSFSTVLNLMKRYDDYIFMSSQPQLYQHVKEVDPELYEEIKERIKEGRWEPEGAMWLEADTNLISGESLVRQILYGKRFMREEFGVDNKILWLPDVFGYSGALPQILKKSGVDKFFTSKMAWNETNKMPNDTFIWEGIDGSSVLASFVPSYVQKIEPRDIYGSWDGYKNKSVTNNTLLTFGYGDGGGGPTYEMLENYKRLKYGIPGMPKVKIEKASKFFDRLEEDFKKNTAELKSEPRWVGEMYLEMHRGTYTSIAKNKKNNRKSELLHLLAESVSVTNMLLCNGEYPEKILRKNQTNILLNQFHDIIPGSSIKEVYDVTDIEYARILKEGEEIVDEKLSAIKSSLNTEGGIFVYNPTPFEISDYIEVDGKTVYAEKIPAHGYKVIESKEAENEIKVSEKSIENDLLKVTFNDKYHIVSVFDKECMREVISEGAEANRFEVFEDYPKAYDAWEITDYYKQKMWVADDVSEIELLPYGIRIKRKYQKSEIIQDIILKNGSKRIDFKTKIDWHEDHVLLKAAFPVDIRNNNATYDIQFGNLERPTHENTSWDKAKFEVSAHKWADLSETGYGVSILNDCKYGYNTEKNVMKISLLKAATYPNSLADREVHEFTYSFYPHKGDFREGKTVLEGYLLNTPLIAAKIEKTNGKLADKYSLVSSDSENVIVETIKKSEYGNDIIVRLYESYNKKSNAVITTGFDFKEVYLCDLMEENCKKIEHNGRDIPLKVKNFEIVTLKFVI